MQEKAIANRCGVCEVPETDVFPCMLDIGEEMLTCGADVHTVEQILVRMGKAYGAKRMNVLVITAVIIVTFTLSDEEETTLTRRIITEGGTDFAKLEALTRLCNQCCKEPLSPCEVRERFQQIKAGRPSNASLYLGGVLSVAGFSLFFGGSPVDSLVAAVIALGVAYSIKHFKPYTPNTMVFNFACSLVTGAVIVGFHALFPVFSVDTVIIGVIMLLIPGVAMTNATRDMLSGDTISGVMRFIESLLWATSLALGFMVPMLVSSMVL